MDFEKCPDVFYMENWGLANARRDGGEYGRYELESCNGSIVYPYVKRDAGPTIRGVQYYDILTPFGYNGPAIIKCTDKEKLLMEFEEDFNSYCKGEHIVAEYARFSPWLKNHEDFENFYNLKFQTQTMYFNVQTDFFNKEFSQKCRNNIRNAIKNAVDIRFDFSDEHVDEFIKLYDKMLEKHGLGSFHQVEESYLKNLFSMMAGNIFMASAVHEGKCISSSFFLFGQDYMHYYLSGNDYENTKRGANHLILYEAAKWAQDKGIKEFHIGGAYHETLLQFKKGFTKDGFLDYFVGTRIRNPEIYEKLLELCGKNGSGYFPEYRTGWVRKANIESGGE